MNLRHLSLILIGLALLPCAWAQKQRIAEGRLINRTQPSILAGGADLEVLELGSGMRIIKTAATDNAGRFRIAGLPESGRLMLRASYKGANYHGALDFNAEGKAYVELDVYDTTDSLKDIRVESVQMAFQMTGDRLQSMETVTIVNTTHPPMVYVHPDGNFRISKAPGILEPPKIRVTAPGAEMPLMQPALESADGQSYYSQYPLRPGVTVFEVQQTLPYADGQYVYRKKIYQDYAAVTIGVIPRDLEFSGAGLTKKQVNAEQNFAVYTSLPLKAGSELVWTFAGGTPAAADSSGGTAAAEAAGEDGGRIQVTAVPNRIGRLAPVLGPLLLLGFVLALWAGFNRLHDQSRQEEDRQRSRMRERREQLLTSLAEAQHRNETGALDSRDYRKQRDEGMRELRRMALLLKKH